MASKIYKGSKGFGVVITATPGNAYQINSLILVEIYPSASPSPGDYFNVLTLVAGRSSFAFAAKMHESDPPTGFGYGTHDPGQIFTFYYVDTDFGWFCEDFSSLELIALS